MISRRGTKINRLDLGDVVGKTLLDRSKCCRAIYKQVIKISHRDSCRLCRKREFVTLNWNIFVKMLKEKRLSLRFIDSTPLCVPASRASSQRLEIYARILKSINVKCMLDRCFRVTSPAQGFRRVFRPSALHPLRSRHSRALERECGTYNIWRWTC